VKLFPRASKIDYNQWRADRKREHRVGL